MFEEEDVIASMPTYNPVEPTGFTENVKAANHLWWHSESVIAAELNGRGAAYKERNAKLFLPGLISPEVIDMFNTRPYMMEQYDAVDTSALAYYAKTKLGLDIKDDNDLNREVTAQALPGIEEAQDVMNRGQGVGAFLGQGVGFMGGAMVEYAPLAITGFGSWGASASFLRGAVTLGTIGVAYEAARQPSVYRHKNQLGFDYDALDVVGEMVITGLGESAFMLGAGGIKSIKSGVLAKSLDNAVNTALNSDNSFVRASGRTLETAQHILNSNPDVPAVKVVQDLHDESLRLKSNYLGEGDIDDIHPYVMPEESKQMVVEQPDIITAKEITDDLGNVTHETMTLKEKIQDIDDIADQAADALECINA